MKEINTKRMAPNLFCDQDLPNKAKATFFFLFPPNIQYIDVISFENRKQLKIN